MAAGDGGGAAPHGHARARRRARRAPSCAAGGPRCSPTAGRPAATATGDLLFSRAFAELAATGSEDAVRALSTASSALARGELMQRADAWSRERGARALPRALPAEDRQPVRGLLPAGGSVRRPPGSGARHSGSFGERLGVAFQMLDDVLDVSGPAGAHRKAPRRGPARRHRDAAADPRARAATPTAALARSLTPQQAEAVCDRIAATGALDDARETGARARGRGQAGAGRPPALGTAPNALQLVADGVVERYA